MGIKQTVGFPVLSYVGLIIIALLLQKKSNAQDELAVLEKTYHAIDVLQNLSYTVQLKERVDGKLCEHRTGNIKMTVNPLRVYYFMVEPRYGAELLFNAEDYGYNIYINPNGFPWLSFTMSPDNKWMRKARHHTILDAGFEYIKDILGRFLRQSQLQNDFKISGFGKQKINTNECIVLSIEKEVFLHKNYVLKEGENISVYARNEGLSDFMVLERNPKYSWYDSPKPGETIVVPNFYAKRVELFIDNVTFLPISVKIYDDLGLFEEVTFSNINVKPDFTEDTFSIDNQIYGF